MTVFLSSHLLTEVEQVASRLAALLEGRLVFQGSVEELGAARQGRLTVGVDRPEPATEWLRREGWSAAVGDKVVQVEAAGREAAAEVCARLVGAGFRVHHLAQEKATLEASFFELTRGEVEE